MTADESESTWPTPSPPEEPEASEEEEEATEDREATEEDRVATEEDREATEDSRVEDREVTEEDTEEEVRPRSLLNNPRLETLAPTRYTFPSPASENTGPDASSLSL